MSADSYITLPGSERASAPGTQHVGPVDGSARAEITVVVRRRAEIPTELIQGPQTVEAEAFASRFGADPADAERVGEVLGGLGLEVVRTDLASRRITVAGTLTALAEAFGAELSEVTSEAPSGERVQHRHREGVLKVPAALGGIVVAVLGLDTRPQARAHYRRHHKAPHAATGTFTPNQLGTIYQFPKGSDGTGQTIAIVELGGGYVASDLTTYFSGLGVTAPSVASQGVDGASNGGGQDPTGADGEVLLDIEVAGALAPGAAQVVYFAPNTDQGFVDAVSTAIHANPTPIAVSISWGGPEDSWTAQSRTALDTAIADAAALGVTVTVAAGDNGSSDGMNDGKPHVDFPASSPHALACGGTSLQADPTAGTITSETVWNDGAGQGATGGGVSTSFPLPTWQGTVGVPNNPQGATGRGVPDVAGDADPATGYQILVDGQSTVVGGTSAVAPLWAALVAVMAQSSGKRFGLLQPQLYAGVTAGQAAPGFQDITSGNNGAYSAGPGWDATTGLGSPNGTALLARLQGSTGTAG